jgi:hypothetical protein
MSCSPPHKKARLVGPEAPAAPPHTPPFSQANDEAPPTTHHEKPAHPDLSLPFRPPPPARKPPPPASFAKPSFLSSGGGYVFAHLRETGENGPFGSDGNPILEDLEPSISPLSVLNTGQRDVTRMFTGRFVPTDPVVPTCQRPLPQVMGPPASPPRHMSNGTATVSKFPMLRPAAVKKRRTRKAMAKPAAPPGPPVSQLPLPHFNTLSHPRVSAITGKVAVKQKPYITQGPPSSPPRPFHLAFFYGDKEEEEPYVKSKDEEETMLIRFKAIGICEEVKVGIKGHAQRDMSKSTELVDGWKGRRALEKVMDCIAEEYGEADGEDD